MAPSQTRAQVIAAGEQYLNSFPGLSDLSHNTALQGQIQMIMGHIPNQPFVPYLTAEERLYTAISYRMGLTHQATKFKNLLELKFGDCHVYCVEVWECSMDIAAETDKKAQERVQRADIIYGLIDRRQLNISRESNNLSIFRRY